MLKRVVSMALCLTVAACAPQGGRWETTDSECQVWNDDPRPNVAVTWSGKCEKGKATGRGVYLRSYAENGENTETRYEGRMKNGDMSGSGTLTLSNGDTYRGRFSEGLKDGKGAYSWANGDRYIGEFRHDKMHGEGVFLWADGRRYAGEFRDGELVGSEFNWLDKRE